MTTTQTPAATLELSTIQPIARHERHGRARDLFTIWFGSNIMLLTVVTGALAVGLVGWAPKWPALGWLWLANNALLVTLAEEALFRGYVQQQLTARWGHHRGGAALAIGAAALLFGLAHLAGGVQWVALASLAGVAYGVAYRYGGLAAAVLAHLGLNTLHFAGFTYPMRMVAG